jgi:hypothetical protein
MDTSEMIKKLLDKLITPKWKGIIEYDVTFETHYNTGVKYPIIDVIFDKDKYYEMYNDREYDYPGEMNEEIQKDIQGVLRYLGIFGSVVIVNVYSD